MAFTIGNMSHRSNTHRNRAIETCPTNYEKSPQSVSFQSFLFSRNSSPSLDISCENEGCSAIIKLDLLVNHLHECQFSPKKFLQCENGCRMIIAKDDLPVRFILENFVCFFFLKAILES